MNRPLTIAINGASGRMGQALLALLRDDARFTLAHALIEPGAAQNGEPVYPERVDSPRFAHDWSAAPALDVVIDFSSPDGLLTALTYCCAHGVALVTGTTGLSEAQTYQLTAAQQHIPLLRAANFSLGVAVLTRLLRQAAAALPDWDLEIVEAHHAHKVDAPSGTALALGQAAAQARGVRLAEQKVSVRDGRPGERKPGTIGFAVIRGGDVVGEHTALLLGTGERVELTHRATDRSIFARGALEAAHWLSHRPAGAYDLDTLLNERVHD